MDLIEYFAEEKQQTEQSKAQLQRILVRIYRNIARYGDALKDKESDEDYVYGTWRALLNTIKAILELPQPGSDFAGARMCLFFGAELISRPGVPDYINAALAKVSKGNGITMENEATTMTNSKQGRSHDGFIPYAIDVWGDIGHIDEIDDHVFVFRRSCQFCLDAQQIAERNLGNQRQGLLNTILLRHGMPREIHMEISSYLTHREPFPYLKKLDIGAAYAPFPTVSERCLECEHLGKTSAIKRTCPRAGLYIWNLALRRFHCFHKDAFNQWSLCSHGSDCKGHHDCSDHSWAVRRDPPEFTQFIEKEASRGNDEFLSLDQVGLGPAQHIRLNKAEDKIRDKRLDEGWMIYNEPYRDWIMTGGLGGLVDSMLHGRVLVKAWSEGQDGAEGEEEGSSRSWYDYETRQMGYWPELVRDESRRVGDHGPPLVAGAM
ncbi:hypothetical protein FAGAP_9843 [Fusarium agapanthi]|uniref:Uncharacterized protein n=1 Tax=Fusarium agapanthi TaxID=1803897 RepID=A0A9P5B3H7_9HYPO|nr:hypothetical protein FAGAP_9843 [Fusarium agapanthi]